MDKTDFLAYRDAEGKYADFHALRHSFITMVGKSGVSPREHQDLARHSTYALTSRYSHSRFYDLAAAVQSLPIPKTDLGPEALTLSATGTDGRHFPLSPNLGPHSAISGNFQRQNETEPATVRLCEHPEKQEENRTNQPRLESKQELSPTGVEPAHNRVSDGRLAARLRPAESALYGNRTRLTCSTDRPARQLHHRARRRAPGGSRTRLSTLAKWCLDRSATGASETSARAEGVEPSACGLGPHCSPGSTPLSIQLPR